MVIVIARVRPKPEAVDALAGVLAEVEEASRREDGCLNYGYFRSITDPGQFVAVEEWRDMDALRVHLQQPTVAKLIEALPDALAEPPEIVAHTVSDSGPLPF